MDGVAVKVQEARPASPSVRIQTDQGLCGGIGIVGGLPMVVIDDVGSEQNIEYVGAVNQAREVEHRFFKVVNYCYQRQVSLIITTNLTLEKLAEHVGKRAWSRLQEMAPAGFMIDLAGVPDYRRQKGGR